MIWMADILQIIYSPEVRTDLSLDMLRDTGRGTLLIVEQGSEI